MKICLVGPGIMPIPPTGWGAAESIIWECATELGELGHEGEILNTPDRKEIISSIKEGQFDFIHIHYDVFCDLIPEIKEYHPIQRLLYHHIIHILINLIIIKGMDILESLNGWLQMEIHFITFVFLKKTMMFLNPKR